MSEALQGPWDADAVEAHLRDAVIPVRPATSGRSGPIVQSLWFDFSDGVRGTAEASAVPEAGEAVPRRLLVRYLGGTTSGLGQWLLARCESEVALRVVPRTPNSWDCPVRMT